MKPMIRLRKALTEEKANPTTTGGLHPATRLGGGPNGGDYAPSGGNPIDVRYGSLRVMEAAERRDAKRGANPLYSGDQVRAMLSARNVSSHERDWAGLGESMAPPTMRKTMNDWHIHASSSLPRFFSIDNSGGANKYKDYSVGKVLRGSKPFMQHIGYWVPGADRLEMPQNGDSIINGVLQKKGYYHSPRMETSEIGHIRGFSMGEKDIHDKLDASKYFLETGRHNYTLSDFLGEVKNEKSALPDISAWSMVSNILSPAHILQWHRSLPEGEFDRTFTPEKYGLERGTRGESFKEKFPYINLGRSGPSADVKALRDLPEDASVYDRANAILQDAKTEILRKVKHAEGLESAWGKNDDGQHHHYEELQSDYHQHPNWGRQTEEEYKQIRENDYAFNNYVDAGKGIKQAHQDLHNLVWSRTNPDWMDRYNPRLSSPEQRRDYETFMDVGDFGNGPFYDNVDYRDPRNVAKVGDKAIGGTNQILANLFKSAYGRYGIDPSELLAHGMEGNTHEERMRAIAKKIANTLNEKYNGYKLGLLHGLRGNSDPEFPTNEVLNDAIAAHAHPEAKAQLHGENFDVHGLEDHIFDHLKRLHSYSLSSNDGEITRPHETVGRIVNPNNLDSVREKSRQDLLPVHNIATKDKSEIYGDGETDGYWLAQDPNTLSRIILPNELIRSSTSVPAFTNLTKQYYDGRGIFSHGLTGIIPHMLHESVMDAVQGTNPEFDLDFDHGRANFRSAMLNMFKPFIEKGPRSSGLDSDHDDSASITPDTSDSAIANRRKYIEKLVEHLIAIHDHHRTIDDRQTQDDANKHWWDRFSSNKAVVVPIENRTPEDITDFGRSVGFRMGQYAYERPLGDRYAEALVLQALHHAISNNATSASFGTGFVKNGDYNPEAEDPKSFWRTHYNGRIRNMVRKVANAFGADYHDAPWMYGSTVPHIRINQAMRDWFTEKGIHAFDNGLPDQIQNMSKAVLMARRIILLKAIG
jgi:hypothetical protein